MDFLRKSAMQLASKMRFVSAQFDALLAGDLWLRNASHANAMARRLEAAVRDIPGVAIQRPVQANSVFVVIPPAVTERLQKQYPFYVWDEQTGEVRWMTLLRHHRGRTSTASPPPWRPRWAPPDPARRPLPARQVTDPHARPHRHGGAGRVRMPGSPRRCRMLHLR